MSDWTPHDVIELVKVLFWGFAIAAVPVATFITMVVALRRNAESIKKVSEDIETVKTHTNSITERLQAASRKLGISEGIAQERDSVLAHSNAVVPLAAPGRTPLPVADDRTATATEKTAEATKEIAEAAKEAAVSGKRSAVADERVADLAEEASVSPKKPRNP